MLENFLIFWAPWLVLILSIFSLYFWGSYSPREHYEDAPHDN